MGYSLYELLWIFLGYSFLGWCVEVIYFTFRRGAFVNRGFLHGPVCPVYGYGLVAVLLVLEPLKEKLLLLYVGSVLITSAIEFLIGFLSQKILHERLWDYSHNACNLGGYICLKFSLVWGLGCMAVVLFLHPLILRLIRWIPHTLGTILLAIFSAAFLADLVVTGIEALKIPKQLALIDSMEKALLHVSDGIGENLSGHVLHVMENKADWDEKLRRYRAALEEYNRGHGRLLRGYPRLRRGKLLPPVEAKTDSNQDTAKEKQDTASSH